HDLRLHRFPIRHSGRHPSPYRFHAVAPFNSLPEPSRTPVHRFTLCTFVIPIRRSAFVDVRYGALNGLKSDIAECPECAKSRQSALQQTASYSITSSAICWRCTGTSRPNALAVLRLITS